MNSPRVSFNKDRFRLVLLAHGILLLLGIGLAFIPFGAAYRTYFISLVSNSQMCLIAIWAGFGTAKLRWRCLGLALGIVYATSVTLFALAQQIGWQLVVGLIPQVGFQELILYAAMFGSLLFLRKVGFQVQRPYEDLAESQNDFQFSVRQLMVVTVVVAVIVVIGKYVRAFFGQELGQIMMNPLLSTAYWLGMLAMTLTFDVATSLISVWAALGRHRPHSRVAVAAAVCACLGAISPFFFGHDWTFLILGPLFSVVRSGIIIGTLLVFRADGYRVVRRVRKVLAGLQAT